MNLSNPIGRAEFGPFFLRVPLGMYFFLAGMAKLKNPTLFLEEVKKTSVIIGGVNVLQDPFGTLYGLLLPYAEVLIGVLLIVGLWTTLTAAIASLMLLSFVIALGPIVTRDPFTLNKDILLLGAAVSLLYTGAGAFSFDGGRKGG